MKRTPFLPPPLGGLFSPPPSPRKRRRMLRESEESQGDMSIERYLLQSDPFRSTSTSKPLPYPLIVRLALDTPWNEAAERVSPIIDQLIKNHIPEYPSPGPCNLSWVSKPGYPGGDEPKLTWFVGIYHNAAGRGSFGPLKDEIRERLAVNGLPSMDVEIVDTERCFGPSIFPIAPGHPAVSIYKQIRAELLSTLQHKLRKNWRGMCLFHLGKSLEASNPTIVVLVSPETVHDWAELESTFLEKIRPKAGPDIEINVEFLPGDCCDAVQMPGESYLNRMKTDGLPEMHHSVGIKHEVGGGTLGGFITLDMGGTKRKGFLTNYHVVRPSSKAPKSIIKQADRYGSSIFTTNDTNVNVFYLAQKDVQATQEEGRRFLEANNQEIRKHEEACERHRMAGRPPPPGILNMIQMLRSLNNKSQQKLQRVGCMPRHLGAVLVSSGRTLCGDSNRILNWAFVELAGSNAKLHYRPNILPAIHSPISTYSAAGSEVLTFSNLKAGEYYAKNGRTTGPTVGVCNGVGAYCNWEDEERTRYDVNGKEIKMQDGWTEEFVILGARGQPFSDAGDSGSWVVSRLGELSGLLYGSFTGQCGRVDGSAFQAGLVTCMDLVRASVNEKTKRRILGKPVGEGGVLELTPST